MFKRKPKKIKILIWFEIATKKIRVEIKPGNTKPSFAMQLLLEAHKLLEDNLNKEIAKESEEKPIKVDYIA